MIDQINHVRNYHLVMPSAYGFGSKCVIKEPHKKHKYI